MSSGEGGVLLFGLPQRREHREREVILTRELLEQVNYLNQFLPPECQIEYIHKDMAKINKRFLPYNGLYLKQIYF